MSASQTAGFASIAGGLETEEPSARDLFTVAAYYEPTFARIVQGCLVAAGIPAVVADDNLVQTNLLWTAAIGGVRILVPQQYIVEAHSVIAAFDRGDFALKDED
jgi:hypothetical protein